MDRIKRGGGDGGEPVRSPQGRPQFSPAAQAFRRAECLLRLMGALTFGRMLMLVEVDGAPVHGICSVIVQSRLRTTTVAGQAGPKM